MNPVPPIPANLRNAVRARTSGSTRLVTYPSPHTMHVPPALMLDSAMKKRSLFLVACLALLASGVAVAGSRKGPFDVIGNVFLQNETPGAPQVGHAAILGTFRAGRVAVTQPNETGAAIIGNNTSGLENNVGGSFSSDGERGIALKATQTNAGNQGTAFYAESRSVFGNVIDVWQKGDGIGVRVTGGNTGIFVKARDAGYFEGSGFGLTAVSSRGSGVALAGICGTGTAAKLTGDLRIDEGSFVLNQKSNASEIKALQIGEAFNAPAYFFRESNTETAGQTYIRRNNLANGKKGAQLLAEAEATNGARNFAGITPLGDGRLRVYGQEIQASIKNFVEIDPSDVTRDIVYACVEGPEAAAYVRGTARLVNGSCFVNFPDHFKKVIVAEGMTVQLTPRSADSEGLAVITQGLDGFRVKELRRGNGTYEFAWEVKAVRRGYEDYRVIRKFDEDIIDKSERAETLKNRQLVLDSRSSRRP